MSKPIDHDTDTKKTTIEKKDLDLDQKGEEQRTARHGEQPEGNGATGKPAAFPPHN